MKKPWNKILPFLIPSVCVVCGVAVPAIVLMTQKHVELDFNNQRFAEIKTLGENKFVYSFHLLKEVQMDCQLKVETPEWSTSDGLCYVKPASNLPIFIDKDNNFNVEVLLLRKDGKKLEKKDFSLFSFKFEMKNEDGKSVWKDSIGCIRLRYEPKDLEGDKLCQ